METIKNGFYKLKGDDVKWWLTPEQSPKDIRYTQ